MAFRMMYFVVLPMFTFFCGISSVILNRTNDEFLMVASGVIFIFSILLEKLDTRFTFVQMIMLALFHWSSQLNWCFPLYLILALKELVNAEGVAKSVRVSLIFTLVYTAIRLSYSEITSGALLVTGKDTLSMLMLNLAILYIRGADKEKQLLKEKNCHLVQYDLLTGLYNFQQFHKKMDELIALKSEICLILIDCDDLKSRNSIQGIESGNETLVRMGGLLKRTFKDAIFIARYGGDEFAVVMKFEHQDQIMETIRHVLETDISQITGVRLTFGYAMYPADGVRKEDLIAAAEKQLLSMKRQLWLKREEHILRSDKLKVVGEMAAGMAHEIRNPLTTLKGFLQYSKGNGYNIETWYELIMNEIKRMSELTAEFLQFSKPQASNFTIQSLQECAQTVISLTESEATSRGHQITYTQEETTIYIHMDKDKVVQVLLNLIKNALEAMEKSGFVFIRVYSSLNSGVIEVKDTGKGIPKEDLESIYNPFYTTKDNGTGLGLSICHKIVEDHRGRIEVNSTVGKGTTFTLFFPHAASE